MKLDKKVNLICFLSSNCNAISKDQCDVYLTMWLSYIPCILHSQSLNLSQKHLSELTEQRTGILKIILCVYKIFPLLESKFLQNHLEFFLSVIVHSRS